MTAHTFPNASEAAIAVALHAATEPGKWQYEIGAVFGAPDRALVGFWARIKDLDGFGAGYVGKGGKNGS